MRIKWSEIEGASKGAKIQRVLDYAALLGARTLHIITEEDASWEKMNHLLLNRLAQDGTRYHIRKLVCHAPSSWCARLYKFCGGLPDPHRRTNRKEPVYHPLRNEEVGLVIEFQTPLRRAGASPPSHHGASGRSLGPSSKRNSEALLGGQAGIPKKEAGV